MPKKKLAVLVSGNGSNLQAVIDAIVAGKLNYKIEVVISNKEKAFALERAKKANIQTLYLPYKKNVCREEYDKNLRQKAAEFAPDYIILLGWMRILTNTFISSFNDRIINLHPALPGTFPGTNAIGEQYAAFLNGKISKCGIMTHFVPDEGVDSGPVIFTQEVKITKSMTREEFEAEVHAEEHKLVIKTLKYLETL